MNKQAYFKLMGLDKKAAQTFFQQTGIPETDAEKLSFLKQPVKASPLPIKIQKALADKISEENRNKATRGQILKDYLGGKGLDMVGDEYTGVPILDNIRNWYRFATKGK